MPDATGEKRFGRIPRISLHLLKRLPAHEWRITLPTVVTLARIGFVPFIVFSMVFGLWRSAFFLFASAALTDMIDGNLARLRNEKTFLGACLDPIADKLLLISTFCTLAFVSTPLFSIPLWFVLVVLGKEVLQIGGAFALFAIKGHLAVRPTILGKMTTLVQMFFIIWLFACYFFQWVPIKTYYTMLGLVIILVCASFMQYLRIGVRMIMHT